MTLVLQRTQDLAKGRGKIGAPQEGCGSNHMRDVAQNAREERLDIQTYLSQIFHSCMP